MRRRDSDARYRRLLAVVLLGACVSDSSIGTSGRGAAPVAAPAAQSGSSAPAAPAVMPAQPAASPSAQAAPSSAPASPPPLVAISGEPFGRLGRANAMLGDLDGDGFEDFALAGAGPAPSATQPPAPAVYVFHGRRSFPASISVLQADAVLRDAIANTATLPLAADGDALQALGDINGDGFADFAVLGLGWFRVLLGSTVPLLGALPLAVPGPGALLVAEPKAQSALYGIGDVNQDGFSDLLAVDAAAPSGSRELRAFVIAGHGDPWTVEGVRPPATLASVPFAAGSAALGARRAGDLDGDGYADMLIRVVPLSGEPFALAYYGGAGKLAGALTAARADARLQPGVLPLADLDGDGRSELYWKEGATVHVRYGTSQRLSGEAALIADLSIRAEASARGSALELAVGDLDGDGHRDLLASDGSEARNGAYSGTVYVVRGTGARRTGVVELGAMQVILAGRVKDGAPGQPQDADELGHGLCSGADVSADRIDDALVGAPTRNDGDESPGTVFLIRGRPAPPQ